MRRQVEPEWLDTLPVGDPRAARSRRDLRRLNGWMNNAAVMAATLRRAVNGAPAASLVELGAGEGRFLWQVARRLAPRWRGARVALLDRQETVAAEAIAGLGTLGWQAEPVQAEVMEWLRQPAAGRFDVMVANLFLHHFTDPELGEMLELAARRTRVFVAIEPRRSWPTLVACHLLWAIGCNAVTRHDAPVSVRAGFTGRELSRLWPADPAWRREERRVGCFSHLFLATK
jgi:hypothetical protein